VATNGSARGGAHDSAFSDALAAHTDRLLPCVHCGFCLPVCPTYTRLGDEADSPRGRLHLMRAVVEGRLDPGSGSFQTHIDRCLGCRACETVCPSGVEYGSLLELARSEAARARRPRLVSRLVLSVFRSPLAMRVALLSSLLFRLTGLPALGARLLPRRRPFGRLRFALAMLAASDPWRRPGKRRPRGRKAAPGDAVVESRVSAFEPSRSRGADAGAAVGAEIVGSAKVGVLDGCVQRWLFAPTNAATVRVLQVNGCRVERVPGQGCCGALHAHGGDLAAARALARRNVDVFGRSGVDLIVVNAAGCGAAMKEYGHLLADDPEYADRARALAARVRDVSEVLAERGPVTGTALPLRATYDAPCHLAHAQRVTRPPRTVLEAIPGLALEPLEGEEECCGGAGIYGLTHDELGGRIGRDKSAAVRRTGADLVVTANPGCAMQIGAWLRLEGSRARVAHLVEVLDESYRRAGYCP
jgi:glycolate oxidase iron-sulfur subunit